MPVGSVLSCAFPQRAVSGKRSPGGRLAWGMRDTVTQGPQDAAFRDAADGRGPRQLTATRGMTIDPDGTVHVEIPARSRTGPAARGAERAWRGGRAGVTASTSPLNATT